MNLYGMKAKAFRVRVWRTVPGTKIGREIDAKATTEARKLAEDHLYDLRHARGSQKSRKRAAAHSPDGSYGAPFRRAV